MSRDRHEEQLMPQIMAMMNATFLYMFCMLGVVVYGIELDPIVIEDSALADKVRCISACMHLTYV